MFLNDARRMIRLDLKNVRLSANLYANNRVLLNVQTMAAKSNVTLIEASFVRSRVLRQATMGGAGATTTRNSGGWSCILISPLSLELGLGYRFTYRCSVCCRSPRLLHIQNS